MKNLTVELKKLKSKKTDKEYEAMFIKDEFGNSTLVPFETKNKIEYKYYKSVVTNEE